MLFDKGKEKCTIEMVSNERMKKASNFVTSAFCTGIDSFATTMYTNNMDVMFSYTGRMYSFMKGLSILGTARDIKYTSEISKICSSTSFENVDETEVYKSFSIKRIRKCLFDIGFNFLLPTVINGRISRSKSFQNKSRLASILYQSNLIATAGLFVSEGVDYGVNKVESIIHTKKNDSSKLVADNYYLGKYHYSGTKRNSMFITDRQNEFKNKLIGSVTANVIGAFVGGYKHKFDEFLNETESNTDVSVITIIPIEPIEESKPNVSETIKTSKKSSK